MKVSITMNHLDDIVIKEIDLDYTSEAKFECFGNEIIFQLKKDKEFLSVTASEGLCLVQDGKINFNDCKENFSIQIGTGFTLVYPAIDMLIKFDFNF